MCGRDAVVEILRSCRGPDTLLAYRESADEIHFRLAGPVPEPRDDRFRSRSAALQQMALSHRISLTLGRANYKLSDDAVFVIESVATSGHRVVEAGCCNVTLQCDVTSRRRGTITGFRSILSIEHAVHARVTTMCLSVLPPALASFVRRARGFVDCADVEIAAGSSLVRVAANRFRYQPSEDDRVSGGRRVDHVPALTLVDIALQVNETAGQWPIEPDLSVQFLHYTDPRIAFEIVQQADRSAMEFLQGGRVVAVVRGC